MGNITKNKVELLAPIGSISNIVDIIKSGADAIYIGGHKYSARAYADTANEDDDDASKMIEAINITHSLGKKIYIAVNTLIKNEEIKDTLDYVEKIIAANVDALIVADMGLANIINKNFKGVSLHASTQMGIASSKGVKLVRDLGFTKAILARELSLKEMKEIKKEVGDSISLEIFVHGSMCYSYSGSCLMSSMIGDMSGNRGRCKGACRLMWQSRFLPKNEKYILSLKDMCALKYLNEIINIGIDTLKIEGRMRSKEYACGVVSMYRHYIDAILSGDIDFINVDKDEKRLISLYNKGGFSNYFISHNSNSMIRRF